MKNFFQRQKYFAIIVLPIIPVIWIIGWILTCFGSPKTAPNSQKKIQSKE